MSRNTFKAVPRQKLRDHVLAQLLGAIQSGDYGPGDQLPSERELMMEFGVGRPSVREALLALEERGLISIFHGRRAQVHARRPSEASLITSISNTLAPFFDGDAVSAADVNEARFIFETATVRFAAQRATENDLEKLRNVLEKNRLAISNAESYLSTDMDLHRVIATITGNALFGVLGGALFEWLSHERKSTVHVNGADLLSYDEHARIVASIVARDADGAAQAMKAHLSRSHSLYQRLGAQKMQVEVTTRRRAIKAS